MVITTSNESQAAAYEQQIQERLQRLPTHTDFLVILDEDNKRVGSGGSTLSVLRVLKHRYGDYQSRRFLVIHAGGDSKRCPQYSSVGKLFSPVPMTIDRHLATLFDVFLLTMASVPGRMKDGMMLLSGDLILLFNPLMIELSSANSAILTFKEDVETGKEHGVCLRNERTGNVQKFLCHRELNCLKLFIKDMLE